MRGAWPSLTSTEPATGDTLWTGEAGDVDAEVAAARAAWAGWASRSLVLSRRDAAPLRQCRARQDRALRRSDRARDRQAARGKRATEVEAVVNKVDISVSAYAERTSQRRLEGALGARVAVRHKPHGVLAVLGPYNFPAHLPNGHIVPALIAGNAVVFKPSEKTPAVGEFLVGLYHEAGVPEGVRPLRPGRARNRQGARRPCRDRRPALHRLGPRRRRAPPAVRRDAAQDPRARNGRQQPARRLERARRPRGRGDGRSSRPI